ncbi:MAG: 5-(carboxyamino)imidazole ribonucleotide synthase [Candidatus Hydrogenedentes bacterium]|nr:5-(carboxyamino)imidazole ribonucleotide synthase [Candidatus Hydrogenedentota bacterium]
MQRVILPGGTIGVLGSGQLGRMFAISARRMGYLVHTYSPGGDTPTGHIADKEWVGSYDDLDQVRDFAREVDVISFEFENVHSATAEAAEAIVPVRPRGEVLHITQNRLREKGFLAAIGCPLPPYRPVHSLEALHKAISEVGCPAVLKTAGWGYDGKGQCKIMAPEDCDAAWQAVGGGESVLEAFVDFAHEASVVAARGIDGSFAHYGLLENIHKHHILDITLSPARFGTALEAEAVEIARAIMEKLEVAGVLCVEFFVAAKGKLLVNEVAPRPHNSGHVTFDNACTSQFEQQVRAVCGLPLGDSKRLCPAVMTNLLGDLWAQGEPNWAAACRFPNVKLHLYGKTEARPGRKMGHLTALAPSVDQALADALLSREALLAR